MLPKTMPDTLDKIINIIRDLGYDRDRQADGSTTLIAAAGGDQLDGLDILAEIEGRFDGVVLEIETVPLTLGEIAIEVENQIRALAGARAE